MLDVDENQAYPDTASLTARDTFVASTAVKLERLHGIVTRLEREADETRALVSDLAETVEQNHRFYTFQQNEKRMKELRLDELLRSCKEIKARLDRIEGADGAHADHREATFEAVHKRLAELARDQTRLERAALTLRRNALVLLGGIFAALIVIGLRLV